MILARILKDIMSFKMKARHDGYSDQFNRIFMTKLLLVGSIVMSVEYFSDQVNCMIPTNSRHSKEFYQAACWISGFYIFEEMRGHRIDKSGYFGMPQRVDFDGINKETGRLCLTKDFNHENSLCKPMTKVYYLHYQWFHVYMAALGIFFYLPYIAFRIVNEDLINLKKHIKHRATTKTTRIIMKQYFNRTANSRRFLRMRTVWNMLVKLMYLFSSVTSLLITDWFLQGEYLGYGRDYLDWSSLNNTMQYTVLRSKLRPRSGNKLLPSMGYCDVHEASIDIRNTFHNENRYICEISPHVLYQYVLAVMWFFFMASCTIAAVGLVIYVGNSLYYLSCCCLCWKSIADRKVYAMMTVREIEYLEYIKARDLIQYGVILQELKRNRKLFEYPVENDLVNELDRFISGLGDV